MLYTCIVEFESIEPILLSHLVKADTLSTPMIHNIRTIDDILLMPVKVSRREQLIVSGDGGFSDMRFLSEVPFESFDRIVCEEYVHVSLIRQFLSGQRVLFWTEAGAEAHTCHVDGLASEVEHLRCWARVL